MAEPKRIQAVQRAMAAVEAIARSDDGLRLQDLARVVGLSPSAVHHILHTLAEGGWVERQEKPIRYRLGAGLTQLADRPRRGRLRVLVDRALVALQRDLACSAVCVCEAVGLEVLLTRQATADRPGQIEELVGSVLPPYTSAASLIHLSFWPEERVQAYREQRPFELYGAALWGSAEAFWAEAAAVRRRGWGMLPLSDPAALRLGVPIQGPGGGLLASFTLSQAGVADRAATARRLAQAAMAAATAIGSGLGGIPPA
jgi:DNA-binding IclR family transcriptional regulator